MTVVMEDQGWYLVLLIQRPMMGSEEDAIHPALNAFPMVHTLRGRGGEVKIEYT